MQDPGESWLSDWGRGSGDQEMKLNSTVMWNTESRNLKMWVKDTGVEGRGELKMFPGILALGLKWIVLSLFGGKLLAEEQDSGFFRGLG